MVLPPGVLGEGIGIKAGDFNGDNLLDLYIVNRGMQDRLLLRNDTAKTIGLNTLSSEIPQQFSLEQNYPNPFNPETKIRFLLPLSSHVKLAVYDASGRLTALLLSRQLAAGSYEISWNAGKLTSGIYFYKIETPEFSETKKMILIK